MNGGVASGTPRHGGTPHVFVADLTSPELDAGDRHHLERALRMRSGDVLTIGDGAGRWRSAVFGEVLTCTSEIEIADRLHPNVTVGFALVKGARPELIVQKLTELGVDAIVPFVAEYSVVKWKDERALRNRERLQKIAREAAMQSGRTWLPTVAHLTRFADLAVDGAALAEPGGDPPSLTHPTILVGPEGGWSPAEQDSGLPRVALGEGVLRAETAAIAAGALFTAMRSGLVVQRTDGSRSSRRSRM